MRCCDGKPGWLSNVSSKPLLYGLVAAAVRDGAGIVRGGAAGADRGGDAQCARGGWWRTGRVRMYWPSRRSRGSRRRGRVGSEGIKTGRKHDTIADNTIPTFFLYRRNFRRNKAGVCAQRRPMNEFHSNRFSVNGNRHYAPLNETISVRSSSLLLNRRKALISRSRMWWPGLCSLLVGCQ